MTGPTVAAGACGVDTIRVGTEAQVRQWRGWEDIRLSDVEGEVVELSRRRRLEGGAVLEVRAGRAGLTAWVEGSCPKAVCGENVEPVSVGQARDIAAGWVAEAAEFVDWGGTLRVNRLDIARDFTGCEGITGELMAGLSVVPLAGRKRRALYNDPALGQVMTLAVRNTGGMSRLYDKHAESGSEAARGRLRCEAQLRARTLRTEGVTCLHQLTDGQVLELGRRRFRWAGFDRPVGSFENALGLLALADITASEQANAIAYLAVCRAGVLEDFHKWSKDRRGRARRTLEQVGAFAAETSVRTYRLDWRAGLIAA